MENHKSLKAFLRDKAIKDAAQKEKINEFAEKRRNEAKEFNSFCTNASITIIVPTMNALAEVFRNEHYLLEDKTDTGTDLGTYFLNGPNNHIRSFTFHFKVNTTENNIRLTIYDASSVPKLLNSLIFPFKNFTPQNQLTTANIESAIIKGMKSV